MSDQDKIISFMRFTGPVLPAQVAKHINSNILLASAHLSEMSSNNKVKVSNLKVGGSPLYYLPEHKEKLQNFIQNFNLKDQQTLNLLKEKKILRERNLELITRVSLRAIKDFAVPLNITLNDQKELFWKWYLLSDQQALEIVKEQFSPSASPPQPMEQKPSSEPALQQESKPTPKSEPKEESSSQPLEKQEPQARPTEEDSKEEKKPFIQKIKDKLKPKVSEENTDSKPPKRKEVADNLFPQIEAYFQERNIKIDTKETVRKNSEINFILHVPSVVGNLNYFCKAKQKKRCDERDLSAAYMEAQSKKLPLLFLYTNEISKKAQEMLDSGAFENIAAKKL